MEECTCSIDYEAECNRLKNMLNKEKSRVRELENENVFNKQEVEKLREDNRMLADAMIEFNHMHGQIEAFKFCIEHFKTN